jgi:urea transport system ATP-binding protein
LAHTAHTDATPAVADIRPLLEVSGLSKVYGALRALDDVSVSVEAGTFHGLIGPNGSGKSTLLKAVAGAHLPTAGTIRFARQDITNWAPYQRARVGLSLKFQITAVLRELSVYDNVLLALQSHESAWSLVWSRTRRRQDAQIMQALDRFRLADRADNLAGELSHGEQQWLEIAMALAPGPQLLLLDEPTGGMSPEERRVTGELLLPIKPECALVIVEHDIDFIKNICDHLTVLDQGRVLCNGTVREIEESPEIQRVYTSRV